MKKKLLSLFSLTAGAVMVLAGCGGGGEPEIVPGSLDYEPGTELRVAGGYNDKLTGISFNADTVGDGLTLSDGKTYHTGDLKPTWAHLKDKLKIDFVDKFTGAGSADKEWKVWENKLGEVDIVAGGASSLTAAGAQGKLVDLSNYLDQMPAFKYYLEQNQIARLSITGQKPNGGGIGAIYFSPYFDGNDDIERMPLIRADLVRKLLDDDTFEGANRPITQLHYQPYMPTTGKAENIRNVKSDGSVYVIDKDYSKYGNIIDKMNQANGLTGNSALKMLKDYIKATYQYDKPSDLFLGYDAAWDADEMVALFRVAHAQLNDLDGNPLVPLFSRETGNMQRDVDLYRFAGSLFGVRGMESRSDHLYFGKDGKLYDARSSEDAYKAVERMHNLVLEGLVTVDGSGKSNNFLAKDAGLMSYDYNQTQTILNDTIMFGDKTFAQTGREYVAIMVPVAKWNDGDGEKYMRFTESWRSVKTDGWAISAAGVGSDKNKLNAALTLIDYAFSIQGQITMSYGPDTFIKTKAGWDDTKVLTKWSQVADKYETFNFNGTQMPVISEGCRTDLVERAQGNYTNFARRYLGSTLNGFPKSQAFEYQCTSLTGQKGSAVLAAAIAADVIKHPVLGVNTANMWYTSIPTTLPVTAEQQSLLDGYTDLLQNFQAAKNTKNVFYQILKGGYEKSGGDTAVGPTNPTAKTFAEFVDSTWSGSAYLQVRNAQWRTLYAYYQTI